MQQALTTTTDTSCDICGEVPIAAPDDRCGEGPRRDQRGVVEQREAADSPRRHGADSRAAPARAPPCRLNASPFFETPRPSPVFCHPRRRRTSPMNTRAIVIAVDGTVCEQPSQD